MRSLNSRWHYRSNFFIRIHKDVLVGCDLIIYSRNLLYIMHNLRTLNDKMRIQGLGLL